MTAFPRPDQSAHHRSTFLARWSARPDIVARAQVWDERAWHRLRMVGIDPGRLLVGDAKPNRYGAERIYKHQ